jgi:hypothetical protein
VDDSFSVARVQADAGDRDFAPRRVGHRDSLFLHATLRRVGGGAPLTMRIRNLSSGGMMAEIGEPFIEGDRLEIDLRGIGLIDGTVMWREASRIGIAFSQTIDPRRARKTVSARTIRPPAAPPIRTARRPKLFGD